ncbi:MAG: hypothetical protein JO248_19215, partial [Acidimicrobiia bacterium]|nr:hypothetical protein [Acidimicrobiia bacterium]
MGLRHTVAVAPHPAVDQELPDQLLPLQLLPDQEEPDQLLPDHELPLQLEPDQLLPDQELPFHVPPLQLLAVASAAAIDVESKAWPITSCSPVRVTLFCTMRSDPRAASREPAPAETVQAWAVIWG